MIDLKGLKILLSKGGLIHNKMHKEEYEANGFFTKKTELEVVSFLDSVVDFVEKEFCLYDLDSKGFKEQFFHSSRCVTSGAFALHINEVSIPQKVENLILASVLIGLRFDAIKILSVKQHRMSMAMNMFSSAIKRAVESSHHVSKTALVDHNFRLDGFHEHVKPSVMLRHRINFSPKAPPFDSQVESWCKKSLEQSKYSKDKFDFTRFEKAATADETGLLKTQKFIMVNDSTEPEKALLMARFAHFCADKRIVKNLSNWVRDDKARVYFDLESQNSRSPIRFAEKFFFCAVRQDIFMKKSIFGKFDDVSFKLLDSQGFSGASTRESIKMFSQMFYLEFGCE